MLRQIQDKATKQFEERLPGFKGVGEQFPIFMGTPNRNYIANFLSQEIAITYSQSRQDEYEGGDSHDQEVGYQNGHEKVVQKTGEETQNNLLKKSDHINRPINNKIKHCSKCSAYYTGKHTCDRLMKMLVDNSLNE